MKKLLILPFLLLLVLGTRAQVYYYYSYTEYDYGPYYFNQTLQFVERQINAKEMKERAEAERLRMAEQTKKTREYHDNFGTYPNSVPDGWHNVVIVAGDSYIGDRKALVENGRIKHLIWDNWLPQELVFSGQIIKAASSVRIEGGTGPFGGLVDVYFLNQLGDNPTQCEPPLKPGSVTFWCSASEKQLGRMQIVFEDAIFGPFSEHRDWDNPAECGDEKQITIYYKPGKYKYRLAPTWDSKRSLSSGEVVIKEGGCTVQEVFDPSGKQKGPKKKKNN